MKKQDKKQYDRYFKIGAVMLSDDIGVKNAAAQLGVPYHKLAYWRRKRGERFGEQPWSDKYYEKEEKAKKRRGKVSTMEERQRLDAIFEKLLKDETQYKHHEFVVDTTRNRAPEVYKAPDSSTDDSEADYEEGDFLYDALDSKDAKPLLLRAAHAGIAAAQYQLGCFYFYGVYEDETVTDLNLAVIWMKEVLQNKSAGSKLMHRAEEMLQEIQTKQRETMLRYLPEALQKQQQAVLDKEKTERENQERKKFIDYAKEWTVNAGQSATSKL